MTWIKRAIDADHLRVLNTATELSAGLCQLDMVTKGDLTQTARIKRLSLRGAISPLRLIARFRVCGGNGLGSGDSPIVAVVIETRDLAVRFWDQLLGAGVYVNLAIPPATPRSLNLLRCSLCAAHDAGQIDTMIAAFKSVGRHLGVIPRPADRAAS